MFKNISYVLLFAICSLCTISWNLPSRQPNFVNEEIHELTREDKLNKKNQNEIYRPTYQICYLGHQKNRLSQFAERDGFVWFGDVNNKYSYFLSSFYPVKIKIWNMNFSCSEAAFQAAKFLHKPELAVRFTRLSGEEANKLGQQLSNQQRGDWYQIREKMMLEVLQAKFQQHPDCKELLLSTQNAYIVAHSNREVFWTDGGDGKGKNRLGYLLMKVREENGGQGVVSKPSTYKKICPCAD